MSSYDVVVVGLGGMGSAVEVEYFGTRYPATVTAEPLVDPSMSRIRR